MSDFAGMVFFLSIILFVVFLVWGLLKNHKVNKKTWLWLVLAILSMVVGVSSYDKQNIPDANNVVKKSSSSKAAFSSSTLDENVVNNLRAYLEQNDTINFMKLYFKQSESSQLNYYNKANVATTKTTVTGKVIEKNTTGTRLYIYIPVEEMPSDVRNSEQNAYVIVAKDQSGKLKDHSIGDTTSVEGYLTGRGSKQSSHSNNWDLTVSEQ
ncbi:hypothetical protein [Leuconostoc mesenteroides]|uniref:hypothetical protein n=1 Tax=Leuconostoc mesenteroides TaxID=1245 RepID=UPI00376F5B86